MIKTGLKVYVIRLFRLLAYQETLITTYINEQVWITLFYFILFKVNIEKLSMNHYYKNSSSREEMVVVMKIFILTNRQPIVNTTLYICTRAFVLKFQKMLVS